MKKIYLLTISALLLLGACGTKDQVKKSDESVESKEEQLKEDSKAKALEKKIKQAKLAYDEVLHHWAEAKYTDKYNERFEELPVEYFAVRDPKIEPVFYTYYDLNHDKIPELILAQGSADYYSAFQMYGFDGEKAVYMTEQGAGASNKSFFKLFDNGYFIQGTPGSVNHMSFMLYKINEQGIWADRVGEFYFNSKISMDKPTEMKGDISIETLNDWRENHVLDLTKLDFKEITADYIQKETVEKKDNHQSNVSASSDYPYAVGLDQIDGRRFALGDGSGASNGMAANAVIDVKNQTLTLFGKTNANPPYDELNFVYRVKIENVPTETIMLYRVLNAQKREDDLYNIQVNTKITLGERISSGGKSFYDDHEAIYAFTRYSGETALAIPNISSQNRFILDPSTVNHYLEYLPLE